MWDLKGRMLQSFNLSPEIILQPNDVILPEVVPSLNLNENEVIFPDIFDSMGDAGPNIHGLSLRHHDFVAVKGDSCAADHGHPMLGAMGVLLVAQTFARQDLDALDLVVGRFVQDRKCSPGPAVEAGGLVS